MGRKKLEINPGYTNKHWLVIMEVDAKKGNRYFLCKCLLCNKEYELYKGNLLNENKCFCCKSCTVSKYFENKANALIGQKFGRLTVISKHSVISDEWHYNCRCECGSEKVIKGTNLKSKATTSCGCYNRERVSEISSGENCNFWIDGRTPQNRLDRRHIETSINPIIRERDNYTCQNCSKYNGYLEVHHIFDFSTYPLLRFEEYNLVTLCDKCHDSFHIIYPRTSTNTLFDLEVFLEHEYKYHYELLEKYNNYYN